MIFKRIYLIISWKPKLVILSLGHFLANILIVKKFMILVPSFNQCAFESLYWSIFWSGCQPMSYNFLIFSNSLLQSFKNNNCHQRSQFHIICNLTLNTLKINCLFHMAGLLDTLQSV